jgi:ribokinase
MNTILVSGLINIETTLKVEAFPVHYEPVRYPFFGVNSTVSGVGYNLAKAFTTLGDEVRFLSLVGQDLFGALVHQALQRASVADRFVLDQLPATPQSVILYDPSGTRMIHTDLKDIQETAYPQTLYEQAIRGCALAALCNINFSRPFLAQARAAGALVATDVHAIADLDDAYNRDFMAGADVLFMSDARLPMPPADWAREVQARFNTPIVVIGLGADGALLAVREDQFVGRIPAVPTRPVVSTIGAGDALFSAFLHYYCRHRNPYAALDKAVIFASYKIGVAGAADGFLDEAGVDAWERDLKGKPKPYPHPRYNR